MTRLRSAREVIEALGGLHAVAAKTRRSYKTVSGWQSAFNQFPSATYTWMIRELATLGYSAPAKLWGQVEAADV